MLPAHLQGKPADCMAVALQAASWGMSPFVVAQKTHLVNGTLGYEAQLVNAVISSSRAIVGRFHYKTIGDWSKWQLGNKGTESGLGVQVGAVLAGESEITWDDVLYIENITTRNSPLWKTRPLQQIKYLGVKYWARLYAPEVILGVYTPDELAQPETAPQPEKDITPQNQSVTIDDVFNEVESEIEHPQKPEIEPDIDDVFNSEVSVSAEFYDMLNECGDLAYLSDIGGYISEAVAAEKLTDSEQASLKMKYQEVRNRLSQ